MMATDSRPGTIITFYSYKGGTGRTMALANVATLLAKAPVAEASPETGPERRSRRVLMIDWDLEAPGLNRFFEQPSKGGDAGDGELGLIDLFEALHGRVDRWTVSSKRQPISDVIESFPLEKYVSTTSVPELEIIRAGRLDEKYSERVQNFDWRGLYAIAPDLFVSFAERLTRDYDYVLIDSRTGVGDIGGICTMLLPEKLVGVFTPNRQSLQGLLAVMRQALDYRRGSNDLRRLVVFPLASRIEGSEPNLLEAWRHGDRSNDILGFQPQFEALFKECYSLEDCDLDGYFREVQIQHVPSYAYGEKIAVSEQPGGDRLSLSRRYEAFTNRLVNLSAPWHDLSIGAKRQKGQATVIQVEPAILDLAEWAPELDEPTQMAEQMATNRNLIPLRAVIARARRFFNSTWTQRIEELNLKEIGGTVTDSDRYDVCLGYVQRFSLDIAQLEEFAMALAGSEYERGIDEVFRVFQDWITLTERVWLGTSLQPVTGSPGLLAFRVLANMGAKAADNMSVQTLAQLLTKPLITEGDNKRGDNSPLVERRDILHAKAFLDMANLTTRYLDESWDDGSFSHLFVTRQEHRDGLAVFLFLRALINDIRNPEAYPSYPAFKLIAGSGAALRAFLTRLSEDQLGVISQMANEDVRAFRANWPDRRIKLGDAELGGGYFRSDWAAKELPESL